MTFSIIMALFPLSKTVLKSAGGGPKSAWLVRLEPSDGRFVVQSAGVCTVRPRGVRVCASVTVQVGWTATFSLR